MLGAAAGPMFVVAFTAIGARRTGYDWRRHAVSSLAAGEDGRLQRANFVLTGLLYAIAAPELARSARRVAGPRVVPVLVGAAGVGLVGAGVFVTDPVAGFPPGADVRGSGVDTRARVPQSRSGTLHNLSGVPVFAGIPVAAASCAVAAARRGEPGWAAVAAGACLLMTGCTALFGAAFGGAPGLAAHGGTFQRVSIATGFGWLTTLSIRSLVAPRGQGRAACSRA